MPARDKTEALRAEGTLNPHPDAVTDPRFREEGFFDPRDVVQVKYEMLRRVRVEATSVTQAATEFGVSRPTFYEAQASFDAAGIAGLVPRKRGPHGPHKLRPEALAWLQEHIEPGQPIQARALAQGLREAMEVDVHPRTIERALAPGKKKPI